MSEFTELLESNTINHYIPKRKMTVRDLLQELDLEEKCYSLLVDGKKANEDTIITMISKVIILPNLSGG